MTRPLQVEVVKGAVKREGGGRRSPLGSLLGRRESRVPEGEIFVDASLDRERAYVGEQILLVYRVYTQPQLAALPQPQKLPAFPGFWVEEIPVDSRSTLRRRVIRGKEYTEITLMKKALFPTRSGDLTLEETVFEIPVRAVSDDPFDRFFKASRPVYRKTPAKTIKILPLPEEGRPASFRGAVGRFSMEVEADRHQASVNDAVGLSVEVRGDGNLRTVGEPVVQEAPDYRRFAPKMKESRQVRDDRIEGIRTWSYVFVPLAPGEKTLPPLRFSYFDPVAASYRELVSPTFIISVARSQEPADALAPAGVRRQVVAMRQDIRYIKPAGALQASGGGLHRSPWFYILLLIPVAGNVALFAHLRWREHLEANVHLFRRRRATRLARERLRKASGLISGGEDLEIFFDEIDRALTGYVADKFNVAPSGLTRERIASLLEERQVDSEVRRNALACLEQCDLGRFAPGAGGREQLESLVSRSRDVISGLERVLA
jgi:hypothetical protein